MQDDARQDAPYGARLLAFALTTSALLGLLMAWLQRRLIAAIDDPNGGWNEREGLYATLGALGRGELACELLLAGVVLVGVIRYGRGLGDRLVAHLSLGAGVLLALDAVRIAAFTVDMTYLGAIEPSAREARMQLWMLSGLLLRLGGFGLLTAALARGEQRVAGRRPYWPFAVAALLVLYPLGVWLGRDPGATRGDSLLDWIPVILAAAMLTLAVAAVRHAARIDVGPEIGAWVRAAAGLERYRDATALRVLVVVCLGVFMTLARFGGFSPLATLGGLALLGLIGPLIALFQIAALVRVADAPVARINIGVALPLIGLGIAAECAALLPIAGFVLGGGKDLDAIRHLDFSSLGGETQALGLVAAVILLLGFRALASARECPGARVRCNDLLFAMLTLAAAGVGLFMILPELSIDRDLTAMLILGLGLGMLITAIWMVTVYLRMLKELAEAMASVRYSGSAEIQR